MRRPTTERTLSGLSNVSSVGDGDAMVPSWHECAGLDEVAPQLAEQERVAVGLLARAPRSHAPALRRPWRPTAASTNAATPRRSKPVTWTRVRPSRRWISAQRLVEGVVDVGRRLAMRGDEDTDATAAASETSAARVAASAVRPIWRSSEHEQDGRVAAGIDDEVGDGVEVHDRADRGRTTARRRVRPRLPDRPATSARAAPRRRRRCPGRRHGRAGARARRSRVRTAAHLLTAHAEEHGRAVLGGVARELRDEARLARARLAADQHGVATAVLHRGNADRELIPFRGPGHERDRRHGAQRCREQAR